MSRRALRTAAVALTLLTAVAVAQERTRDKKPATFQEVHGSVQTHFQAGSYGKAVAAGREMMKLLTAKRSGALLGAMPAAPAGYEVLAQPKGQDNPLGGALAMSVGSIVTQNYKGATGTLKVTITADSPMMGMVAMMFTNPAMRGPDAELIKYKECDAILKKEGNAWTLQLLIEETLVEGRFGKENDEFALAMFSQAAVTKLHATISN